MKLVKLEKTIAIIVFVILFLIIFSTPVTIWLAKRAEKQKLLLAYQQQIAQTAAMTGGNIQPVQPIQQPQPIAQPVQPVTQTQPVQQPQQMQPIAQPQQVQPVTQMQPVQQPQQVQPVTQTTTNNVDCFI